MSVTGSILQPVTKWSIQSPQLDKLDFANWSRAVGGAVQSLIVHQYGHTVGCETQVQLHSGSPIPAGLDAQVHGREWRQKDSFCVQSRYLLTAEKLFLNSKRKISMHAQGMRFSEPFNSDGIVSGSVQCVYNLQNTLHTTWRLERQSVHQSGACGLSLQDTK